MRDPTPTLCRNGGQTCAACCHGTDIPRAVLERRLAWHTRLFAWLVGARTPGRGRLLLFELLARGVSGLGWAVLLLVPGLGGLLRPWLRRRTACAFLGFEDVERSRVGCLLHPRRWNGHDVRQRAAFALWLGFGCGDPHWHCLPAWRYARGDWRTRRALRDALAGLDWYERSRRVFGGNCPASTNG